MKTSNQTILHCNWLYQRSTQFLRWNLPVLVWTVISLSVLKCEGTSPDPKTILVPLLVAAEPNTSANLGGNQSGSGTETPIGVGEIPASPPLINEVTYITNPANPADDPYSTKGLLQFQKTSVSFQKPVPANTEINFYFGKNNMALNPDGTVTNALETLKRTKSNFSGYTYLCDSDKKYKVFVVAKNEFGISTKELRIGHARKCADAPKTTAVFGDCNVHCIEATKAGDTIELTAKFNLPVQGSSLNLDIVGYSPRSLPETIAPFADLEIPIPNAGLHTIKTNFNIQNKELLCARVESTLIMGQPFQFTITNGYLSIPNE